MTPSSRYEAVLIHGIGCDRCDWAGQIEAVAHAARVVAPDLPGHGQDRRPYNPSIGAMADFINDRASRDPSLRRVLVGHSMGCRIALEAARRDPGPVAGLVLIEGSLRAASAAHQAVDPPEQRFTRLLADFEGMFSAKTPNTVRTKAVERVASMERGPLLDLLDDMGSWDSREAATALRAIRSPVLVIQSTYKAPGSRRRPLGLGEMSPWLDLVVGCVGDRARIVRIEDCGHFVQCEEPERVSRAIVDFIRAL